MRDERIDPEVVGASPAGSRPRRLFLLLGLGLVLAACGRKGPLRLPGPEDEDEDEGG
jgi:hypothetical protein